MKVSDEAQVLNWFERALEVPPSRRSDWLDDQQLAPWIRQRVQRLLDAESELDDTFLEAPANVPEGEPFPQIGERVGSYELLSQIDAGGMGVVYLARRADDAYEQQVAIKLIRPLHLHCLPSMRRRMVARFENERALLARLNHPNIARILDGGTTETGIPYLVMEYVDGASLIEYCHQRNVDLRGRLALFKKVCDGAQEAHRHLIVHRDLKPENILVTQQGEPRLLDFGIARTLEGPAEESFTMFTAMTPAYASPEQVRRQPLTTRSDVYSLGVVLYQLLTGIRPYDLAHLTPAEAERTICDSTAPSLRQAIARSNVPDAQRRIWLAQFKPELELIVAKAMHKDPERRYASAQALGDDLERYLRDEPVHAHPDSKMYRLRKFVERHKAGSALGAIAGLAVIAATGIALWQANVARQAARDTESMNAFLLDILQQSDPFDAGRELTLSEALDRSVPMLEERFGSRPDLSAQLRFGIGYSMLSRYRLAEAETQLRKAVAESMAEFGATDIRTLRAQEGVAGLLFEQGQVAASHQLYEEIIAAMQKSGQERDPLYVTVLGNYGNLFLMEENYEKADEWLQKAYGADQANEEGLTLDRANLLSNLAHAAHGLEHYDRADAAYREAQGAYETLFPQGNPDLAFLLNNRALLAEDRGDQQQALELHQQSLAMRRRLVAGDHPMIIVALNNVARLGAKLRQLDLASTHAEQATQMANRVYTTPNMWRASAHATLAEVRSLQDLHPQAQTVWLEAKRLMAEVPEPRPSAAKNLERVRSEICARAHASGVTCSL